MKTKLNLTIDEDLVPKTKAYARKNGMSVSELVEEYLREVTKKPDRSFSQKWRGKFKIDEKKSPRFERLKDRYQL
jgi:hypothetical protein